jgi:hypothetical protein
VAALVEAARRRRERILTSSSCVARAWRDGTRQALLSRLLHGVREEAFDPSISRVIGALCGAAAANDVFDAHVASLAEHDDIVLTSDATDIHKLRRANGCAAEVKHC